MLLLAELQQLLSLESMGLTVSLMQFLIITCTGLYTVHVLTRITVNYLRE